MTLARAIARIDHQNAQIIEFDETHAESHKIKAHTLHTRQHGSTVRTEHEFFGEICAALANIPEVLIASSHTAQSDFRHYVETHRPALSKHIVGWEIVDAPTEAQLVALAKQQFMKIDQMKGKNPLR